MMSNFSEAQIKAVAEHSWWRKTSVERLAEAHNLTKGQINEIRRMSTYKDHIRYLMFANRSADDFKEWVKNYKNMSRLSHLLGQRFGLDPRLIEGMVADVRKCHKLVDDGKIEPPKMILDAYHPKVDTSEVKIIGSGDEYVYLYYFPEYKMSAILYYKFVDDSHGLIYQCNIGRTDGVVTTRVAAQIGKQLPEKATIALIIRTNDCRTLEDKIHKELKRLRRWVAPNGEYDGYSGAVGKEWFMTNPDEVIRIYQNRSQGLL